MTGDSSTDNRILARGIPRELEYHGDTEEGRPVLDRHHNYITE